MDKWSVKCDHVKALLKGHFVLRVHVKLIHSKQLRQSLGAYGKSFSAEIRRVNTNQCHFDVLSVSVLFFYNEGFY